MNLIGLDFEASGTNPWGLHVPIELGLAHMRNGLLESKSWLIGRWNWSEFEWSEEAENVHHIPKEDLAGAHSVAKVDILAAAWIIEAGLSGSRMWTLPVGWNVAGYDRQFITRWMPALNSVLSYRSVDLNAVTLTVAGFAEKVAIDLKGRAKDWADAELSKFGGPQEPRHRAGQDARAALLELRYLNEHHAQNQALRP